MAYDLAPRHRSYGLLAEAFALGKTARPFDASAIRYAAANNRCHGKAAIHFAIFNPKGKWYWGLLLLIFSACKKRSV
jgi:hypothetical protein